MAEKYELTDPRIMTFAEASKKLNKNDSYLRILLRDYPNYFLEGTYKKFGKTYLITQEGIDYIEKVRKKRWEIIFFNPLNTISYVKADKLLKIWEDVQCYNQLSSNNY